MNRPYISLRPYVPWTARPRPIDWAREFGRTAELVVEIGFGLGDFLVRMAREHVRQDFVGIELQWVPVRRALRKIALARLENVRLVKVHAWVALERLFPEKAISSVYALFPCPWPHRTHMKHRLFSKPFLELLNSRLQDGARALVVTDHQSYFEWVCREAEGTGFRVQSVMAPARFQTKYERKWQELGQARFFEIHLNKCRHLPHPVQEEIPLKIHHCPAFDPACFHPEPLSGDIVVAFKEMLYDPERRKAMVRAVVREDNLLQNFWIEVVEKPGTWQVRPARGCSLLPTLGVQRALDAVYEAACASRRARAAP